MNNSISKNKNVASKSLKQRTPQHVDGWFDDFISGVSSVVDVAAKIIPLIPLIPGKQRDTTPVPVAYVTGPVSWLYAMDGTVSATNITDQPITICYTTGLNGDSSEPQPLLGNQQYDATNDLSDFPTGLITISSAVVPQDPAFTALTWSINELGLDLPPVTVLGDVTIQAGYDEDTATYLATITTPSQSVSGDMTIQDVQGNVFKARVQQGSGSVNIYFPPGVEILEVIPSLALNLIIDTPSYNAATAKRSASLMYKS
jgi:hypothetical protein